MPKVIDYSKDDRAVREKDAFNKLLGDLKRTPNQEEVYQQAYGTPYVVFSDEFETPRLKDVLGEYQKGAYDAYGNIRKTVFKPAREKAYRSNVHEILGEDTDPLTAQRLTQQITGNRQNALGSTVRQRANQYNRERSNALWDFLNAKGDQQAALDAVTKQEDFDQNLQAQKDLYSFQKAQDSFYDGLKGSGRRGGGGGSFSSISDPGILAWARGIADGIYSMEDVPYNDRTEVLAALSQLATAAGAGDVSLEAGAEAAPGTEGPLVDQLASYLWPNVESGLGAPSVGEFGEALGETLGGTGQALAGGVGSFLKNSYNSNKNFIKGLFGL